MLLLQTNLFLKPWACICKPQCLPGSLPKRLQSSTQRVPVLVSTNNNNNNTNKVQTKTGTPYTHYSSLSLYISVQTKTGAPSVVITPPPANHPPHHAGTKQGPQSSSKKEPQSSTQMHMSCTSGLGWKARLSSSSGPLSLYGWGATEGQGVCLSSVSSHDLAQKGYARFLDCACLMTPNKETWLPAFYHI